MLKVLADVGGTGRKWLPIGGLLLLSLLWAVGWVRADLEPGATSEVKLNPWLNQATILGAFATLAAVAGVTLKKRWPTGTAALSALLVGLGLFAVPAALNVVIQGMIDDVTRVAMFSMTPLFAVIFERHLGNDSEANEIRGGFPAAMAAVAGTFLVFPVELPRSYGSALALIGVVVAAAVVAAANCLGIEVVQRRNICPVTLGAVSTGSAAALLCIGGLIALRGNASTAALNMWAVSDALALALLFWLMRWMSAAQVTTRFLIAPLLANMMSLALLRPHVQIQSWIGLFLIAAGSGWMLFAPREKDGSTVTTLGAG